MKKKVNLNMLIPYIGCIIALIGVLVISKISETAGFYSYVAGSAIVIGGLIRIVSKPVPKDK
ncbi:hypothetical protein [Clostridium sp. DL1XJH146]